MADKPANPWRRTAVELPAERRVVEISFSQKDTSRYWGRVLHGLWRACTTAGKPLGKKPIYPTYWRHTGEPTDAD